MQSLKVRIERSTIFKSILYNLRNKNNIFISEQPEKDIEFDLSPHYNSDIIAFICSVFLTFIMKRSIKGIHKMF